MIGPNFSECDPYISDGHFRPAADMDALIEQARGLPECPTGAYGALGSYIEAQRKHYKDVDEFKAHCRQRFLEYYTKLIVDGEFLSCGTQQ